MIIAKCLPISTKQYLWTLLALVLLTAPGRASQMPTSTYLYPQAIGVTPDRQSKDFSVQQLVTDTRANVFWPGETPSFTFHIENKTAAPLQGMGQLQLIETGTQTVDPDDPFNIRAYKIADAGSLPVKIDIAAKGYQNVTVRVPAPKKFGCWAIVLDIPGRGRDFAGSFVRTPAAAPGRVQFPAYAMDAGYAADPVEQYAFLQRIGVKGIRQEIGYTAGDTPNSNQAKVLADLANRFKLLKDDNLTLMITSAATSDHQPIPVVPRRLLNDQDQLVDNPPQGDMAWMPSADEDYQNWIRILAGRFGWPKGPVNAIELWNEPWEGISISGWGADIPRYRDLYTRMAQGIGQARREEGVQVLIGGTCSSMNTDDKLFPDGSDAFLKWLDFTSIHYQPMGDVPVLYPAWMHRDSPFGPVKVWDTESWMANSEDRVPAMLSSLRSQGLQRTAGVLHEAARVYQDYTPKESKDGTRLTAAQPLSTSVAVAAWQSFIGERKFSRLFFQNGLPWVFVFDGLKGQDDGAVVIVGDLGYVVDPKSLLYRSVQGLSTARAASQIQDLKTKLAAVPETADREAKRELRLQLSNLRLLHDANLTLSGSRGAYGLYDFNGNPVLTEHGKTVVPLNRTGYYLLPSGKPGSMKTLLAAIGTARIDGYEPLDVVAKDFTAPIEEHPSLRLRFTNILNRRVSGALSVTAGALALDAPEQAMGFNPNETKDVLLKVTGGRSVPENTYLLRVRFDAGKDGTAAFDEPLHVNVVAHKTITVDGTLNSWAGVTPIPIRSDSDSANNLTQKAWLPFLTLDEHVGTGAANVYLAYDENNFYYAARIVDNTPSEGGIRYANRDDDSYFYPDKVSTVQKDAAGRITNTQTFTWPAGVRHYSYRKIPDIPSASATDNVQIAFNVVPEEQKGWYLSPPGTPPHYMVYKSTDYEYALNPVKAKYGGGTELWRLLAPGVPMKHYFPRQPKAPVDGGPVPAAKLVMKQEGNFRIVEAAIPWTEIPEVRKRLDAGGTIKFNCRINDDRGPGYELAGNRSVSRRTVYALHELWLPSWANEVEFGFGK